jgi:rhomboid protease GluP
MLLFIAYNLIYGLKGGIDNAAHIGGLVSGLVTGFSFYPLLKQPELKSRNLLVSIIVTFLMTSVSLYFMVNTKNPLGDYTRIFNEFVVCEEKALSVYKLSDFSSDDIILTEIEKNGIPNWMRCKELVDSAAKINGLPEDLEQRIVLMKKYCNYRIKSFNMIRTSIREHHTQYNTIIEQYNQKIELIVKKLNGEDIPDSELEYIPDFSSLSGSQPGLYVLDGKIVKNIDNLDQKDIKDMSILKAEAAMSLYGEQGRNGAVIITTWKGSEPISLINPNIQHTKDINRII